jgi:hypothetical protein
MAESASTVSSQMAASASAEGTARPSANKVISGMTARGELVAVAMPYKADTLSRTGQAAMTLGMCAMPTAGAMVYSRGQTGGALAMSGIPQLAKTLERAGAMAADITPHATPAAQGVTNALASAKGKSIGVMFPEKVGAAQFVADAFGNLSIAAQPKVRTVCDVSFVANGEVVYETHVLDGETCKDPVADGRIEAPTKESTAQYHYNYAGWSLTDGGDAIESGTVDVEILKEQPIDLGYDESTGLVMGALVPPPILLTVGFRYKVVWDGVVYENIGIDTSSLIPGTVSMGNGTPFGFPGNDEPFIIVSRISAARYPSFPKSGCTDERRGCVFSQMRVSLSTPSRAMSFGILIRFPESVFMASNAQSSFAASTATGRFSLEIAAGSKISSHQ